MVDLDLGVKKSEVALSTTVSKKISDDWKLICQHQKKSSYALLRELIEMAVDMNKEKIDKMKAEQRTDS